MMDKELLKNFRYYIKHQDELVAKYNGKYVVIADQKVIGTYDDEIEAINKGAERYERGSYLVHLVGPGESNYIRVYRPGMKVYAA